MAGTVGNAAMQERMAGGMFANLLGGVFGGMGLLDEGGAASGAGSQAAGNAGVVADEGHQFAGKLQKVAYDTLRNQAFAVAWMSALQKALGVPVTGVASIETVDKMIADHPVPAPAKGKKAPAPERAGPAVVTASLKDYRTKYADVLAGIPEHAAAPGLGKSNRSGDASAPEDEAVQNLKLAKSYNGYVSGVLKAGTFLGHGVVAHPEFHARLANATAFLRARLGGNLSDEEIGKAMGVHRVSHFRTSTATRDNMYHGSGFAIDLNPSENNWLLSKQKAGKGDKASNLSGVMNHVADLIGGSQILSAADLAKNAREGDTAAAYAEMAQSNADLIRYRSFAKDDAALDQWLANGAPEKAKTKGKDAWKKILAADEKLLSKLITDDDGKAIQGGGFTDLKLEVVQAMRDAGGLRWGGTDLGGDSGDLMHFDGGTMDTAKSLRAETKKVRAQRAAKAAPKPEGA